MTTRRLRYFLKPIVRRPVEPLVTRQTAPDRLLWLDASTGAFARGAAAFDGATRVRITSSAPALRVGAHDWAAACWVRLSSTAATQGVMGAWSDAASSRNWRLSFDHAAGAFRLQVSDGAAAGSTTGLSTALANGTFEAPALAANTWQAQPAGATWAFDPFIGIANGSGGSWASGVKVSGMPSPSQFAILQQGRKFYQDVVAAASADYTLAWRHTARDFMAGAYHDYRIDLDGVAQGASIQTPAGTTSWLSASRTLRLAPGTRRITFQGVNSATGDNTTLLDSVTLGRADDVIQGPSVAPPGGAQADAWYRLLVWYDHAAKTLNLKVSTTDGQHASGSVAHPTGIAAVATTFHLGSAPGGADHPAGAIDQAALFKSPPGGITAAVATIDAVHYGSGSGVAYSALPAGFAADSGLVAWYELDRPGSTWADSHSGGLALDDAAGLAGADGVVEAPADDLDPARRWSDRINGLGFDESVVADRPAWRSAGFLDFDGAGDRLSAAGPVVGNRSAFTLLAKVRLDALPAGGPAVIFTESDAAGSVVNRLSVTPTGSVVASYRAAGGTLSSATSDATLATGVDAFLGVRRQGTSLQVFVGGLPSGPLVTIGAGTDLAGATARVGGPVESSGFSSFDGRIYDIFAVGQALSDARIAGLSA